MTDINIEYFSKLAADAFINDPLYISCVIDRDKRFDFIYHVFRLRLEISKKYDEFIVDEKQRGLCILHSSMKKYTSLDYLKSKYAYSLLLRYPKETVKLMKFSSGLDSSSFGNNTMLIYPVFVGGEFQGQGVASALLRRALNKYNSIALETQNDDNISFYKSLGFEIVHSEYNSEYNLNNYYMLRKTEI